MPKKPPEYEVYAIRYAHREALRHDHFIGPPPGDDPHNAPMPMDYFVWLIRDGERQWVVDTGFSLKDAKKRDRQFLRSAAEGLQHLGADAAAAELPVIVTHLHYDHIGGFAQFPNATFHLQDDEMRFATGRHMTEAAIGHAFEAEHIAQMVYRVFDGQVRFHDGDAELAPGLSLHKVGGHTMGLQVVRVHTRVGWIVLASDACHYYENFTAAQPFPIVFDVGRYLAAYHTLRGLADDPSFVIPGHDPLVMTRYAPAADGLGGIVHRLDAEPSEP